jgi:biotin-(acetyl-CoA carboxylase) ligase
MTPPPDDASLVLLDETTSTQEHARALVHGGAAHGTTVVARTQTAGRGRRGRTWMSGPHGLWMSVVLRGVLPMTRAPRLALAACDVVMGVLVERGVDVYVKWPNDLLVPAPATSSTAPASPLGPFRKVGGLLLEAIDTAFVDGVPVLHTAVLGLGVNLCAPAGGFPAELATTAGSLVDGGLGADAFVVDGPRRAGGSEAVLPEAVLPEAVLPEAVVREQLRLALARALAPALAQRLLPTVASEEAFARVRARLAARSATLGRRVQVDGVAGIARALDDDGALVIDDEQGMSHVIRAGDVSLVGGGG